MGRGGEFFISCFLGGSITATLLLTCFSGHWHQAASIPYLFVLLQMSLFAVTFRIERRSAFLMKNNEAGKFAAIAAVFFFLSGFGNGITYREGRGGQMLEKCGYIEALKEKITEKAEDMIDSEREFSVAMALLVGDKGAIPHDLKESYRNSGAAHALALSGLHIGIVYSLVDAVLFLLGFCPFGKWLKLFFSSAIIAAYALFTGLSPSVQRAAIMIFICKFTELSGRSRTKWSGLIYAAFVILLINPDEITDVGFQLSFAAVAGIITIYPHIKGAFSSLLGNRWWYRYLIRPAAELSSISVACQITTLPLVLYYFRNSPDIYIITNLAAVPLITAVIYLTPAAIVFTLADNVRNYPAAVIQWLLEILNDIISYLGK